MNDLLDAVDALTKPVVATRLVGVTHDHEWKPVTRPLTKEERDALRKAHKPTPKPATIATGQHHCSWCATTVDHIPAANPTQTISRRDDPPLLDQLADRVRSSLSDGRGTSTAGAGILIDVTAYDTFDAIDGRIRAWITVELGGKPGKSLTLAQLLRAWYMLYDSTPTALDDNRTRTRILENWATTIRDILDPPEQIAYRGEPCPICGQTRAMKGTGNEAEDTVALWAILRPDYRPEGSYALCRACDQVLARDTDPLQLRARMNGVIAPPTHLTQNVADILNPA